MGFKDTANEILKETGESLHYNEITDHALKAGMLTMSGQTPHACMWAFLYIDTLNKIPGPPSMLMMTTSSRCQIKAGLMMISSSAIRVFYESFSRKNSLNRTLIYLHRYRPDTVSIILNDYFREYHEKISAQKSHQQAIERSPNTSQGGKTKALREIDEINKINTELREHEDEILYPLAT